MNFLLNKWHFFKFSQTGEVAAKMAKYCPEIKLRYAVRGEEVTRNSKLTDHVIIGTPGKILDWSVKVFKKLHC